jgi:hypothetical protein
MYSIYTPPSYHENIYDTTEYNSMELNLILFISNPHALSAQTTTYSNPI